MSQSQLSASEDNVDAIQPEANDFDPSNGSYWSFPEDDDLRDDEEEEADSSEGDESDEESDDEDEDGEDNEDETDYEPIENEGSYHVEDLFNDDTEFDKEQEEAIEESVFLERPKEEKKPNKGVWGAILGATALATAGGVAAYTVLKRKGDDKDEDAAAAVKLSDSVGQNNSQSQMQNSRTQHSFSRHGEGSESSTSASNLAGGLIMPV